MKPREGDARPRASRRRFLGCGAGAAGASLLLPTARGAAGAKLNVAGIGLGARGLGNLEKCTGANIVALCDVDWQVAATAFGRFPQAARHRDFREMLDKEKGIDAVVVSTPDHTHAVVTAEAMKRGKHVYTETPLAHDVREARTLVELARKTGVVTQMGNERHSGEGIRRAVEMLWGGGLGPITEVHCWSNRPQWPQGVDRPNARVKQPAQLEWDLWLGPAPARSYAPAYHPYRWRGWLDFGTGALGAAGTHLLDVVFWGLRLGEAETFSVSADSTGVNGETYPEASTVRYRFPARGDMPPVEITWYDGGRLPSRPSQLPYQREIGSNGSLFVGDEHLMMFGPTVFGTNPKQIGPRTLPEFAKIEHSKRVDPIPRVRESDWTKGNRHIQEWLAACHSGKQPCSHFGVSAPLTEMVLLGNVAVCHGQRIDWNVADMRIVNDPSADRYLRQSYRKGWHL